MPAKHDPHKGAAEKTLALLYLLIFSGRKHYLPQLADTLQCSKQTVGRLVENIVRSGHVEVESGKEGNRKWFRAKTLKPLPGMALQPEEIRRLLMCRDMVLHLLPGELRESIDQAILRTTSLLPDQNLRADALEQVACSRIKGFIDYSPFHNQIDDLSRAIGEKAVCMVAYTAASSDTVKVHHFAPLKIMAYHEALYVGGYLVTDKGKPEVRHKTMLAVHRMQSVTPTRRSHDFDPGAWDENDEFGFMEGRPFTVRVKFEKPVAAYICERQWSSDQKIRKYKNGKVELQFTARSRPEVVSWVLSFGSLARVLSPRDVRQEVKRELLEALAGY